MKEDLARTVERRKRLDAQLELVNNYELRHELELTAIDLEDLCCQLQISSAGAAGRRERWQAVTRLGAGLTAVAAAAGGSSLIAGSHGTWSKVIGWVVLLIAVLGAAFNALGGQQEYERNRGKRREYDALWWEVWNYALYELVDEDDKHEREAKLNAFIWRWKAIGGTNLPSATRSA